MGGPSGGGKKQGKQKAPPQQGPVPTQTGPTRGKENSLAQTKFASNKKKSKTNGLKPYTTDDLIAAVQELEKDPNFGSDPDKVLAALRELGGTNDENFKGLMRVDDAPDLSGLDPKLKKKLTSMLKHKSEHTGLVEDENGFMVAASHTLTGISAGQSIAQNKNLPMSLSGAASAVLDPVLAVTLSGDLGQAGLDSYLEGGQSQPKTGPGTDASYPELNGDIDGYLLGNQIASGEKKLGGKDGMSVSQLLAGYYDGKDAPHQQRFDTMQQLPAEEKKKIERESSKFKDVYGSNKQRTKDPMSIPGLLGPAGDAEVLGANKEFWDYVGRRSSKPKAPGGGQKPPAFGGKKKV